MRPRIIRVLIILALSGFVLSGAAVGSLALARGWSRGRIFPGVACGRVDLGGLTQEAAAARLAGAPLGELALELTVQIDDAVRTFSPEQAGISLDAAATAHEAWLYARTGGLPQRLADLWRARRHRVQIRPVLVVEEGELHGWLVELANEVNVPPVNASFDARTGEIIPEQVGRRIDTDRLRQELLAALREGKASLVVSRQTIPPATTAETLAAVPRNLLSRFITQFNPEESDRSHNVYLGAKLLNGTVVPPGGEFSFNRAVGERTEAAGFRTALEIVNQEFVPGIGGGICQVASTVYNAALEAGMEIIERANHSRPVKYVPLGRDATVVHGYLDLRFRNPYDQPVVVLAYADESYLEVRQLGGTLVDLDPDHPDTRPQAGHSNSDRTITAPQIEEGACLGQLQVLQEQTGSEVDPVPGEDAATGQKGEPDSPNLFAELSDLLPGAGPGSEILLAQSIRLPEVYSAVG